MIRIRDLSLPPDGDMARLVLAAARQLRISPNEIKQLDLKKKSVDARKKNDVRIIYTVDVGIMPILDQAATINMALSRNGCVMDRKLCEIISKNWIFPNPFDKEPFDADVAGKKESFRKAGIEYTINQIDEYRACGVDGIHLYALNKYDDVAYIAKEAGLIDLV